MSKPSDFKLREYPEGPSVSRRSLLLGMGGAAFLGTIGSIVPSSVRAAINNATPPTPDNFWSVSVALTGQPKLDKTIGNRIFSGLSALDNNFNDQLAKLEKALTTGVEVKDLQEQNPALAKTAQAILKAWYLGIVGEGDKAHVVAYEHALMYTPLADVCVLPSYARGEPHYWAHPPFIKGTNA